MPTNTTYTLSANGTVLVKQATESNGITTNRRYSLSPGASLVGQPANVIAFATESWTPSVLAAYEASKPVVPPPDVVALLWQAAHDYEYAQVSGSAIGLLAMGVMQGKPKCIAVQGWIRAIWTEYYARKAALTANYDFSVAGVCPHSIPELMAELGL